MWLGIAYCVYGLLYLLGIPHVAPKYRNRTWTRRYQRTCGIGWLMIGIPWLALYVLSVNCQIAHPLLATLIVVLALPSISTVSSPKNVFGKSQIAKMRSDGKC